MLHIFITLYAYEKFLHDIIFFPIEHIYIKNVAVCK